MAQFCSVKPATHSVETRAWAVYAKRLLAEGMRPVSVRAAWRKWSVQCFANAAGDVASNATVGLIAWARAEDARTGDYPLSVDIESAIDRAAYDAARSPEESQPLQQTLGLAVPSLRECRKCGGTGKFITGVVNGIPVGPANSPCFRCGGKGHLTAQDARRNWGYDQFYRDANVSANA